MNNPKVKLAIGLTLALLLGFAGGYALKDQIDNSSVVTANELYVPAEFGIEPLAVPSAFERIIEKSIVIPDFKTVVGERNVQVTANVPGMTDKDIVVEAGKNYVTIKGNRVVEQKDTKNHFVSATEDAFVRTVQLPCNVDGKKVKAAVKDGVLTVTLPKLNVAQKQGSNVQ